MSQVRLHIVVSKELDQALRIFLASQGGGRKGDLSRFIQEAIAQRLAGLTSGKAVTATRATTPDQIR